MLPTQKTPPKQNLHELTVLVYGPYKYGKSSWCAQADGALFLATESGLNHLEVYQQPISSWDDLLIAAKDIADGHHAFRTIIIDTIDNAYRMCADHVCRKCKVEHESDLDYGKGYALVNAEFYRVLNKLALLPYGLFLVSHSQEKEIETRTGRYTKIVPTLPDKARKLVLGLVDTILFCDLEPTTGADGKPTYRHVLRTKPSTAYEAGDRTGRLPEVIDLDFAAFAAAFAESGGCGAAGAARPASSAAAETPPSTPTATKPLVTSPTTTASSQIATTTAPATSSATGSIPGTSSSMSTASPASTARPATVSTSPAGAAAKPRAASTANSRPAMSSPSAGAATSTTSSPTSAAAKPRTTSTASR